MASVVGSKGQIVIEKPIRERLGIEPGWQALQLLVDQHLEVYFIPPAHRRSLRGAAKPFIRRHPQTEEDWDAAVGKAVAQEFLEGSLE